MKFLWCNKPECIEKKVDIIDKNTKFARAVYQIAENYKETFIKMVSTENINGKSVPPDGFEEFTEELWKQIYDRWFEEQRN